MAVKAATAGGEIVSWQAATNIGPGHMPLMPHPEPNRTAPSSRGASRVALQGRLIGVPSKEVLQRLMKYMAGVATSSAPPITNISVGFHAGCVTARNDATCTYIKSVQCICCEIHVLCSAYNLSDVSARSPRNSVIM